jgi:glycerol-3-phosphate O-acyltransferase / dihydroxyacetone phosphate acyltransferase
VRVYRALRWLLQVACRVFFRRIEVVGRAGIPADGAVIFCGNHPNSLLDPILITAFCGRVVHFAAKDTLFDSPLLRFFLVRMGAVPVRRRMDHKEGALDNQGAFDALIEVLGQGRAIGIFPEGLSHDESQLAPLKTGAARIALAVKRRWPELPVYLVPSGLSYFSRNRFRSNVLVQFGDPIALEADPAAGDEAERAAVKETTGRLEQRLRALTINADSWETIWVLDGVRRLYQPEGISLEDRVELARRFNTVYPTVAAQPEVRALYLRIRDFLVRMSALGVDDELLRRGLSLRQIVGRVVGHLLLIGFWAPLFIIGAPIHAPLGLLFKIVGNRFAPRKDVVATTKFVLGLLGMLLVYAGLAGLAAWKLGWTWGLLAVFILPLSGKAFIHVLARAVALRHLFLTTGRVLVLRAEIAALRAERTALEREVVAAVDRFRPPDMTPLFPRAAATTTP